MCWGLLLGLRCGGAVDPLRGGLESDMGITGSRASEENVEFSLFLASSSTHQTFNINKLNPSFSW